MSRWWEKKGVFTRSEFPPDYQLIDLYGEGVPGILYSDGQTTLYREPLTEDNGKETVTVKYAHPNTLLSLPIQGQSKGINPQLMDITGDGHLALVVRQGGTTDIMKLILIEVGKIIKLFLLSPQISTTRIII